MRKCPVCDIELVLKEYEGEKLMSCSECHGYLIDLSAVERIKRKEQISSEQLQVEIEEEFSYNSEYEMRCPRCRMTMKKVIESLPGIEVEIDYCK
jgi:Zn-finger nucleic acid-binding protein